MKLSRVAIALLASITPIADARLNPKCASSLHIIVARGSLEPQGEGTLSTVADLITKQIPGSDSVAVVYPATLSHYKISEQDGVTNMTKMVESYLTNCPKAKVALLGYSQGAQDIGDMLCGTSEVKYNQTKPLAQKFGNHIAAIVQMGDPTFVAGMPYDAGTSTKNGVFKRPDTKTCLVYTKRLRSYCDKNDLFCASGNSLRVHTSYINIYAKQAAAFVVKTYHDFHEIQPSTKPGSNGGGNGKKKGNAGGRSSEPVVLGSVTSAMAVLAFLRIT